MKEDMRNDIFLFLPLSFSSFCWRLVSSKSALHPPLSPNTQVETSRFSKPAKYVN